MPTTPPPGEPEPEPEPAPWAAPPPRSAGRPPGTAAATPGTAAPSPGTAGDPPGTSAPRPAAAGDPSTVPCVGAVVHDRQGRLLLIRRAHEPSRGLWSLPGGRVEAGESAAQAVEREVREETGLEVRAGAPVGRVRIPSGRLVYEVTDLRCEMVAPAATPVAGDDADAVLFADAATIARLPCTPDLVETLRGWGVLPH
ncbi:NUDIX domain-containing protein [Geodermatophilus sp. YIM 151500]|uniref:NUDIX hydrolase n=1 Tax=Geodermatophilus sp. YIM 151500 TaxID=2984531 RepID=UPI0021E3D4AA|nr:NUDIX domain-containing protein [Geodermatophilus sp. YIM 151500]MCV2488633.1 NUDIX domain-containing protein [Geodermatophilus sp. YIM 151500]